METLMTAALFGAGSPEPPLFQVFRGKLSRVLDGDTVEINVDLGWDVFSVQQIRLQGIDCPERNTTEGADARAFTMRWFSDHAYEPALLRPDLWVYIYPEKNTKGAFVRTFVRYVARIVAIDGSDLVEELKKAGHIKK